MGGYTTVIHVKPNAEYYGSCRYNWDFVVSGYLTGQVVTDTHGM